MQASRAGESRDGCKQPVLNGQGRAPGVLLEQAWIRSNRLTLLAPSPCRCGGQARPISHRLAFRERNPAPGALDAYLLPMASDPARSPSPEPVLWHGTALFNLGFRPFYLLAALFAVGGIPLWLVQFFGAVTVPGPYTPMGWHAHEMVFGFAVAVIAGFLLTAARNWTGLPTPTHAALAGLAALWLAGRVLMLTGPAWAAMIVDVAFLPVVAAALWLPLQRSKNRNRLFVALLLALAAANLAFHLAHAGVLGMAEITPVRFALYLVVLIVTIMGGRVIPSFTRNAIPGARTRMIRPLDLSAIALAAGAFMALLVPLPGAVAGVLCLIAAGLHALRLWTWDPWCTRGTPILWILHLAYAWIPIGLLLLGLHAFGFPVAAALGDHALSTGAVGGMIIGMITRTARGHTGLPLQVNRMEVTAYVLVLLAALARVVGPLLTPAEYVSTLSAAGALWSAAFLLYLVVYLPLLIAPRVDGRPG